MPSDQNGMKLEVNNKKKKKKMGEIHKYMEINNTIQNSLWVKKQCTVFTIPY